MNRQRNQYSVPINPAEFVDNLLEKRCVPVTDSLQFFRCKVPVGVGIDDHPSGYKRTNCNGKVFCHVLVLKTLKGDRPDKNAEASHLCGNSSCCNPNHLTWESRAANIARRGCAGFVLVTETGRMAKVCMHDPPCMVARLAFPVNDTPAD